MGYFSIQSLWQKTKEDVYLRPGVFELIQVATKTMKINCSIMLILQKIILSSTNGKPFDQGSVIKKIRT